MAWLLSEAANSHSAEPENFIQVLMVRPVGPAPQLSHLVNAERQAQLSVAFCTLFKAIEPDPVGVPETNNFRPILNGAGNHNLWAMQNISHFEVKNKMNKVNLELNKGSLACLLRQGNASYSGSKFRGGKLERSYLFINSPLCSELLSCFGSVSGSLTHITFPIETIKFIFS